MCVPNSKILGAVVPEKSLTKKVDTQTHRLPDKHCYGKDKKLSTPFPSYAGVYIYTLYICMLCVELFTPFTSYVGDIIISSLGVQIFRLNTILENCNGINVGVYFMKATYRFPGSILYKCIAGRYRPAIEL